MINELYEIHQNNTGFIGISTAFEDFNFNTASNTTSLLQSGNLVGVYKEYFENKYGMSNYSNEISFPIAFDKLTLRVKFLNDKNLKLICQTIPYFNELSVMKQLKIKENIIKHYCQFGQLAETFVLNQPKGTPSFILFDNKFEIKNYSFGHQSFESLNNLIDVK